MTNLELKQKKIVKRIFVHFSESLFYQLWKEKDKHFFLQCDQHNFMEADARIVWNPYYSITGADGAFKIDGLPAGKYKVTAWQPYVGESSQEVTVAAGAAKADFTLTAK